MLTTKYLFNIQILILPFLFEISSCTELDVEYYKNLITENIAKSKNYQLPNDRNTEFEAGTQSEEAEYYGTHDFLVVGAGSAGSVVATRLSEMQSWKTLLLEAGDEETDFTNIPNMQSYLFNSPKNWGYRTVPQKYFCPADNGTRCSSPRGKSIGGTSAINGCHYVRGNAKDFDRWADLGFKDWSYKKVLEYFKKSENSQVNGDESYHGKRGYLNVEYSEPLLQTMSNFIEASVEVGEKVVDYNGRQQLGVGRIHYTTKEGQRDSTGKAFLSNARRRDNLNVVTKAFVTNLIIDGSKKVQGVNFVKDGKKFKVFARKEVILSAGAYNSPQILILSGIGPKQHLKEIGVHPIEDLPAVGQNLADNPSLTLSFSINYTIPQLTLEDQIREFLNGTGPLTKTASGDALIYTHLPKSETPDGLPTFEILYSAKSSTINFFILTHHPKSRGSVKLKSNDPIDHPLIDANWISDPDNVDINNIIKAIKFVFKLSRTSAFKRLNATFIQPASVNNCGSRADESDEYLVCFIKHNLGAPSQPSGTTSMGFSKNSSVVNPVLKVHGIGGLRVADVGITPTTLSGHMNAVAIMIGEMCADFVKIEHTKN